MDMTSASTDQMREMARQLREDDLLRPDIATARPWLNFEAELVLAALLIEAGRRLESLTDVAPEVGDRFAASLRAAMIAKGHRVDDENVIDLIEASRHFPVRVAEETVKARPSMKRTFGYEAARVGLLMTDVLTAQAETIGDTLTLGN